MGNVAFTGVTGSTFSGANMSLVDQWQKVTLGPFTPNAADLTGNIYIGILSGGAGFILGETAYIDGVQVEQQPLATPYVETDGATAARTAARVQAPANLLNETQGWVAFRARMDWSDSSEPSGFPLLFDWRDNDNNRFGLAYVQSTNSWTFARYSGGLNTGKTIASAVAAGDLVTIIGVWTSTKVALSINGAAFSSTGGTQYIPTLAATLVDIGSKTGSTFHFDSDVLWFASGSGTLTDSDASTINAFGSTDPSVNSNFGSAANVRMVWTADTASYTVRDYDIVVLDPQTPTAPGCSDQAPTYAPNLFNVAATDTTATLSFVPSSPATYYYIAYGLSSQDFAYGTVFKPPGSSSGALTTTINDLSPKSTYYFKIRAGNGCKPGDWGNIKEATTQSLGANTTRGVVAGTQVTNETNGTNETKATEEAKESQESPSPTPKTPLVLSLTKPVTRAGGQVFRIAAKVGSFFGTLAKNIPSLAVRPFVVSFRFIASAFTITRDTLGHVASLVFGDIRDTAILVYYDVTARGSKPKISDVAVSINSPSSVTVSWKSD